MARAAAPSPPLCELCMLIFSLVPGMGAGVGNCARSKWASGFDHMTSPPSHALIGLSADPPGAPNRCAPLQGKGSSAASAATQPGNHECVGTCASPSRGTNAAFGHNWRCRPGNDVCIVAARTQGQDCLHTHEHGRPSNGTVCTIAAENGHLDVCCCAGLRPPESVPTFWLSCVTVALVELDRACSARAGVEQVAS